MNISIAVLYSYSYITAKKSKKKVSHPLAGKWFSSNCSNIYDIEINNFIVPTLSRLPFLCTQWNKKENWLSSCVRETAFIGDSESEGFQTPEMPQFPRGQHGRRHPRAPPVARCDTHTDLGPVAVRVPVRQQLHLRDRRAAQTRARLRTPAPEARETPSAVVGTAALQGFSSEASSTSTAPEAGPRRRPTRRGRRVPGGTARGRCRVARCAVDPDTPAREGRTPGGARARGEVCRDRTRRVCPACLPCAGPLQIVFLRSDESAASFAPRFHLCSDPV